MTLELDTKQESMDESPPFGLKAEVACIPAFNSSLFSEHPFMKYRLRFSLGDIKRVKSSSRCIPLMNFFHKNQLNSKH